MVEKKMVTLNLSQVPMDKEKLIKFVQETVASYNLSSNIDPAIPTVTVPAKFKEVLITQIKAATRRDVRREN